MSEKGKRPMPKIGPSEYLGWSFWKYAQKNLSSTNPQTIQISQKSHRKKIGLRSQLKP